MSSTAGHENPWYSGSYNYFQGYGKQTVVNDKNIRTAFTYRKDGGISGQLYRQVSSNLVLPQLVDKVSGRDDFAADRGEGRLGRDMGEVQVVVVVGRVEMFASQQ